MEFYVVEWLTMKGKPFKRRQIYSRLYFSRRKAAEWAGHFGTEVRLLKLREVEDRLEEMGDGF